MNDGFFFVNNIKKTQVNFITVACVFFILE